MAKSEHDLPKLTAEQVHVAEGLGNTTIGHHDGHLVQRFRQERPEVPVVVGRAQTGARIALDRVVQVRKAQRIAKEEDGRVVADDVPIAFLGIEFQGGTADIAFGISRAALACHTGMATFAEAGVSDKPADESAEPKAAG